MTIFKDFFLNKVVDASATLKSCCTLVVKPSYITCMVTVPKIIQYGTLLIAIALFFTNQ